MSYLSGTLPVRKLGLVARLFLFFALCTSLASAVQAKSKSDFDLKSYNAMIARAEASDTDVDYTWLRLQCSAQLSYAEENWKDWQKADTLVDTNPEEALRMARERLSGVWTDFMAHIVAQLALEKLGQHDAAMKQERIVSGIMRSIGSGHKGTSAQDAFGVVSVAEEYRILFILHLKHDTQSLVHSDGHSFDVFDVMDTRTNQKRQIWFNIDLFFGKELGL